MSDALAKLPSPPAKGLAVVMAGPSEDGRRSLRGICKYWKWRLYEAHSCREALSLARKHHAPVVISETSLPDGDWRTILGALAELPQQPRLIVSSRFADHSLWADVLSLGGYDVLITPFDATEVSRVVFLAWQFARRERERKTAAVANVG
jgi:DNA-binding NtrC family response regulator